MEGVSTTGDSAKTSHGSIRNGDQGNQRGARKDHSGRGRGSSRGRGADRGRGSGHGRGRGGFASKNGSDRPRTGERTGDMGRGAYQRLNVDKRKQVNETRDRRAKPVGGDSGAGTGVEFSKEEIEAEERKPKKKVAVLIGYAGTGYKGMQINSQEKTIEGDLFKAFVHAGAIAKANADDPKKSSLVRCARTDKGVHAAGNVISLKLIVEDPDVVTKINEHLPPQIRVWGIERTNGSFSCYQSCDSRWYEYLIPTFSFIPPHPKSYLGQKLVESVKLEDVLDEYQDRQKDAASFWENAEDVYVKPILDKLDSELRASVMEAIHALEVLQDRKEKKSKAVKAESSETPILDGVEEKSAIKSESTVEVKSKIVAVDDSEMISSGKRKAEEEPDESQTRKRSRVDEALTSEELNLSTATGLAVQEGAVNATKEITPLEAAIKEVKAAYITAKKAYRISEPRRARVQEVLNAYIGTRNFHNYTVLKKFSDPSAQRVIRSFKVGKDPVIINDTEWLSLKVHGQSFMMHQIRKMVAMAALVVRCGSPISLIQDSYGPANISIPKAPGLGLLLERPVFETYNERALKEYSREKIDFDKFQKEIDDFKQREIYDRIFREEEQDHQFHAFFQHVDTYRTDYFLWVTATGLSAAKQSTSATRRESVSDDEMPDVKGEEG